MSVLAAPPPPHADARVASGDALAAGAAPHADAGVASGDALATGAAPHADAGAASGDALATALAALERALDDLDSLAVEEFDGTGGSSTGGSGTDLGDTALRLLRAGRRLGAITAAVADRFDTSAAWAGEGACSGADWLRRRSNESFGALRGHVSSGAAARRRPVIAAALRAGVITPRHAAAIDRAARDYPGLAEELAHQESRLVELARRHDPATFARHLFALCHRLDPIAVDDAEEQRRREAYLNAAVVRDGMVRVEGLLPKDLGHLLLASLEAGRRTVEEAPGAERSRGARNLDALHRILTAAASVTGDDGLPTVNGARPTAVVLIPLAALLDDAPTGELAWLERFGITTEAVTALEAWRLACDSTLEPVLIGRDGTLTAAAPRSRTIPHHLRRAVHLRDRHCRGPGCSQRIDEVHHIRYFSRGGRTEMANLLGLCFTCHQLAHHGWRITGDPGRAIAWHSPEGEVLLCAT